MSFFPIKDSSGITQLVIHKENVDDHLAALSDVPVESTIAIEGQVRVRPVQSRRNVSWWPSLVVLDPHPQHFKARYWADRGQSRQVHSP
jgi:hypothetical protein